MVGIDRLTPHCGHHLAFLRSHERYFSVRLPYHEGNLLLIMDFSWTPVMSSLFQILGAALIPGSSQANMVSSLLFKNGDFFLKKTLKYFELYSGRALGQATAMLSDLKLGQYTKGK